MVGGADLGLLARQVASRMRHAPGQRSFLIVSRSQGIALDLFGPFKPGAQDRVPLALKASGAFRVVIENPDVIVFEYLGGIVP